MSGQHHAAGPRLNCRGWLPAAATHSKLSEEGTLAGEAATTVFVPHLLVMNDETVRNGENRRGMAKEQRRRAAATTIFNLESCGSRNL